MASVTIAFSKSTILESPPLQLRQSNLTLGDDRQGPRHSISVAIATGNFILKRTLMSLTVSNGQVIQYIYKY